MESEQERAAWYQAHRDDPDFWDAWEEAPPTRRPRGRPSRGLAAKLTIRFTAEEAAIIRAEAEAAQSTYSEVVRRAIRDHAGSRVAS